jgi:hypothetical protein
VLPNASSSISERDAINPAPIRGLRQLTVRGGHVTGMKIGRGAADFAQAAPN